MQLHQHIFTLLCLIACVYAIARGAVPERITAGTFLAGFVVTNLVQTPMASSFVRVEWRIAAVDAAMLIVLVWLALRSTRYWPLPMASMQLVDVLGHLAKALDAGIVAAVYFALVAFISFPMIGLLAVATRRHRRRLARYGVDYAWVWQLPPAYRAGWRVYERVPVSTVAADQP